MPPPKTRNVSLAWSSRVARSRACGATLPDDRSGMARARRVIAKLSAGSRAAPGLRSLVTELGPRQSGSITACRCHACTGRSLTPGLSGGKDSESLLFHRRQPAGVLLLGGLHGDEQLVLFHPEITPETGDVPLGRGQFGLQGSDLRLKGMDFCAVTASRGENRNAGNCTPDDDLSHIPLPELTLFRQER